MGLGNIYAAPGLMLLVKDFDPQNTVHGLLGILNVMTFWVLAVRAIGLARLSGASFAKAAAWVFGIWAAYTGFFIGLGPAGQDVSQADDWMRPLGRKVPVAGQKSATRVAFTVKQNPPACV